MAEGVVYLLHFSEPLGDVTRPRMSARHYVGWSPENHVVTRIKDHRAGFGAAITRAASQRGIDMHVVAVTRGSRDDERRRKRNGNHHRRCVICQLEKKRGVS